MSYIGEMTIKDAHFAFPRTDFSGTKWGPDGDPCFELRLDDPDDIQELEAMGAPVREWLPKNAEPGDEPVRYIKIKVKYHTDPELSNLNPVVWLIYPGDDRVLLDGESVATIDRLNQERSVSHVICKFTLRSYPPNKFNPEGGVTAYCQKLLVYVEPDEIDAILHNAGNDISDTPF